MIISSFLSQNYYNQVYEKVYQPYHYLRLKYGELQNCSELEYLAISFPVEKEVFVWLRIIDCGDQCKNQWDEKHQLIDTPIPEDHKQ